MVSKIHVAGGAASGWHHHAARDLYRLVVSGVIVLEYGPGGKRGSKPGPETLFISPGLVHRDVNPDGDNEFVIVNILVGDGPPLVNVDWPK